MDEKVTEVDVSENVQGGKAEEGKERNGSNAIALLQHPVLTTWLISLTESYPENTLHAIRIAVNGTQSILPA